MRLNDRLRRLIDGLPPDASVMLPVASLEAWLGDGAIDVEPDLTVDEVAKVFGRSPTTVRSWIRDGRLDAYTFLGHEYRITRRAVEQFQERERKQSRA